MKKIVFLTGAGISAESGISTFRDSDGLWENYSIEDVCTADAIRRNPALVHEFYNQRRRDTMKAEPNAAHRYIADLYNSGKYDVEVVTQNVDDLHERGGMPADRVTHLHGELMKVRATDNSDLLFTLSPDAPDTTPDTVIDGHHVRPHIVFFQEPVPMLEKAVEIVAETDVLVIVGTSLNVYPAASLIHYTKPGCKIYYIDPRPAPVPAGVKVIAEPATKGVQLLAL